jgi:DEAD/DEAH box helicase domain-containing protein
LRRIAAHYGASPQFILCSATVGNPEELARKLSGLDVRALATDGAPRSGRRFVFWNPARLHPNEPTRRSASVDASRVLTQLVRHDVPSIVFTKSRVAAELIYRYVRDSLAPYRAPHGAGSLADRVSSYRGGYLPEERRAIESRLFSGDLRAVVSTNALELGIDVGSLDASVLVGFPPTVASTWQQAGRAGRSHRDALAVVVAYEDPIDQYLMRHPEYFFSRTPESAVLDPENATILRSQLSCAAAELPLAEADSTLFGEASTAVARDLTHDGLLADVRGRHFWSDPEAPARCVSLRMMSSDTVTIVEATGPDRVLGTVDAISAPEVVYPGAIYLHEGDSYFVRALDLLAKVAMVERRDTDYYTQPVLDTSLRVRSVRSESPFAGRSALLLADATVTWVTVWFKKIRYHSLESIGHGSLDLPPQTLETVAAGWSISNELARSLSQHGHDAREALSGVRNLFISAMPLLAMCEPSDIGGIVDSSNRGVPTIFLYDRFPGGMGYAARAFERFADLVRFAGAMVRDCPCEVGCPSCVGLPVLRPAIQQDPDIGAGWPIPSKRAARALLAHLDMSQGVPTWR